MNHCDNDISAAHLVRSSAPTDLLSLARAQRPGHALDRELYTRPDVFEHDLEKMLLRHWFCVAHASSLARAGDYLVVDLGAESLIIVRTSDGDIRALLNVCRHRGSRLCENSPGRAPAGRFTCPYHAWTYGLDGRLLAAREMPAGFDQDRFGLKSLPVRVVEGLVFTTFARRPLDFEPATLTLREAAGKHGWERAKVAHRELYSIRANWKLAVENYMECYHCQPAHVEFSRRHVHARPEQEAEALELAGHDRAAALGISIEDLDRYGQSAMPGQESHSIMRLALCAGIDSATLDNKPAAPLMGVFKQHDGNTTAFDVGPISTFLAYADHGIIYRFIPRSVDHTDMEVLWLVHEDAVEGRDYDLERLVWLWHTTSLEDKKIVESNQAGVTSRFFEPGPYSLQETYTRRFVEWYLSEIGATGEFSGAE